MTVVTFFDGWFVGHLGNQALASLALVFPVLVNVVRFVIVSITCVLVLIFQLDIKWLFSGVSVGLLITGIGQFLCLYSSPWKKTI